MKSKKLLSFLMALSIVASSSIILGTTTKAATLSGTSYTTTDSTLLFNVQLRNSLYADGSVRNTNVTWNSIPGAATYELKVTVPESATSEGGYKFGYDFTKEGIVYVPTPKVDGNYSVKMTAYDSNGNIIRSEMYIYRSEGTTFTPKYSWVIS